MLPVMRRKISYKDSVTKQENMSMNLSAHPSTYIIMCIFSATYRVTTISVSTHRLVVHTDSLHADPEL